jgi:hypothetical protein
MHIVPPVFGVEAMLEQDALSGAPGETVAYTVWVTNTGNAPDTYDVAVSGNTWATTAPATVGPLAAGEVTTVTVTVEIPAAAANLATDEATVTFTSQTDPTKTAAVETTTTAVAPLARLEVAHLAPFAVDPGTAVTVTLNGTAVLTDFMFADSTGYLDVPAGTYDVAIYPAGSPDPAITGTVTLEGDKDYSAIAVGGANGWPLSLLALEDNNTAPAAGNFKLRLGHLAPFAAGSATLADVRLQDGTIILDDVPFGAVAAYAELPAGTYDLKITTPDGVTTLIDPLPVTFNAGDIVTAFAVGDGVNQPLGVFAWPGGVPGFLLPLKTYGTVFLPLIPQGYTVP